eukprot:TRINITY_DN482_c0_g1_i1.p1 TRINITY_DN482_c0_g1~~TRINITY_DN482_c0_g1_i1.p1  ORF type:complete len:147 (+),score=65.65 TRINITY_DN482_c0_g1_i1:171-611(+)
MEFAPAEEFFFASQPSPVVGKAMKLLGVDGKSQMKIMDRLGVDEDEYNRIEKQINEQSIEDVRQKSWKESWIQNRRQGKAMLVLGHNPSDEKAMEVFGMSSSEFEQAKKAIQQSRGSNRSSSSEGSSPSILMANHRSSSPQIESTA